MHIQSGPAVEFAETNRTLSIQRQIHISIAALTLLIHSVSLICLHSFSTILLDCLSFSRLVNVSVILLGSNCLL